MEPRFLVDLNVGRLAKWLRAMGFDTRFDPGADDRELIEIGLREDRALLTKDTGIAQRRVATSRRGARQLERSGCDAPGFFSRRSK